MPLIMVPTIEPAVATVVTPQLVTTSIQENSARATSVNVTYPTRQSGDLLTVIVASYGSVTPPSGWTTRLSGETGQVLIYVFTRVTDNAEGTQAWTCAATDLHTFYTVVTRGYVWGKGQYNAGSGTATSMTLPAFNPGVASSLYLGMMHAYGNASSGSFTWPSPFTKIAERFSTNNDGNGIYNHGGLATINPANAQSYGPYSVTSTDNNYWAGVSIALSPAA